MKTALLLCLAILSLTPIVHADQVINYPADKPIFSISFPDGWDVEIGEESVSAASPDELVNMELIALDAGEIATAIDDAKEGLEEELKGIKWTKPETGELNGFKVTFLNGNVTTEGVKLAVNCAVFAPKGGETFFMLFNAIPLVALEQHGGDVSKVLNSIKGK
ncbi:hypothetical protein [Prosthecobacter sp.]|uniref:hypothetical protein n=1 Tax=Prosthecobacter sp. TaxID=1965333 RepID=UPI001D8776FD|nr:hypothetical protein [Prosthecobacter sp.]MCB1275441.1 hypothetical protein [Prosthecobacter sp.]